MKIAEKISSTMSLVSLLGVVLFNALGTSQAQDPSNSASSANTAAVRMTAAHDSPVPSVPTTQGKAHDDSFVIGADDVLAVNVWKEPEISRSVPVRSDGRISLPLVGEVQASGQTPQKLEKEIATKLQSYISEPEVTVIVQEIRSQRFNVLGQGEKPGSYPLANPTTILDAIALAGGFRDFAKQKSVYVLRQNQDGTQTRIPFNYKDVIKGKNPRENVKLVPRDTVVVP